MKSIAKDSTASEKKEGETRRPLPSPDEIAKLPPDGGPNYNRLIFEKSPYLLQHAGNPVKWYPWGEEAFEKARKEDKPVFLSIGYSTCHWCHVMEVESFENEQVAELLNRNFVSIKVDREERPDIDNLYMNVTIGLTGSGGWPMTVVLTPDRKPFFAGTYFPRESQFGRLGMLDLVPRLAEAWKTKRQEINESADQIASAIGRATPKATGQTLTSDTLTAAYRQLSGNFDSERGGFGHAPKFPSPHQFSFLLRYGRRSEDPRAAEMVEKTLSAMRRGGIFDHVGFGFHRYSTDADWLVPHFEKMLYDQAMLGIAYSEAHQATGKREYAETAGEIFTYVLRDMTSPEGGFYSAEDADSEGVEGKFYLWTPGEILKILGREEGELFNKVYNVKEGGNFHDEAGGEKTGGNILHLEKPPGEIAEQLKLNEADLRKRLETSREKLFAVREKRIHPLKDDKILTDWNGLMIAALAKGSQATGNPEFAKAAARAADFLLSKLRDDKGRLLHRYRQGSAAIPAHLDDYAFLIWGLLELYEATFEVKYLQSALDLNQTLIKHFRDAENGGFFLTADDSEKLLVRSKEVNDGAIPSGNSVAALNLLRIGRITGDAEMEKKAAAIFSAFSAYVGRYPAGACQLMCALDFALGPSYEIVIAGKPGAEDAQTMLKALRSKFAPNKIVLFRADGDKDPAIARIAPFTKDQTALGGKATAYVCQNYACKAPTTDIGAMLEGITTK